MNECKDHASMSCAFSVFPDDPRSRSAAKLVPGSRFEQPRLLKEIQLKNRLAGPDF